MMTTQVETIAKSCNPHAPLSVKFCLVDLRPLVHFELIISLDLELTSPAPKRILSLERVNADSNI